MSFNVQNKINFRAQNDNIISTPQTFSNEPVEQPVDEEKSNAAKWMIGLTATAAIVIGGLWAAKKGHLGESAQKYANKLLGSATDAKGKGGTSSTSSSTSASTSSTTSTTSVSTPTGATSGSATSSTTSSAVASVAAAIPPLVVARKAISKLIKSPKNLADTIQSLQDAGVKFTQEGNSIVVKTGKAVDDLTTMAFNESGNLTSILKPVKNNCNEVFEFNNGKLKTINKFFTTKKKLIQPLQQNIELDDTGKIIKNIWSVQSSWVGKLSIERSGKNYISGQIPYLRKFFEENYDELPKQLKKLKIYDLKDVDPDKATYLTARVAKYWDAPISKIPKEIPTHEILRHAYDLRYEKLYNIVYDKIELARNAAARCDDSRILYNDSLIQSLNFNKNQYLVSQTKEQVLKGIIDFLGAGDTSSKKAEIFMKLLEEDLGRASTYTDDAFYSALNYMKKFSTYGLDKDIELMEISVKPLKECSYDDVMKIIKHRAPEKAGKLPVVADDFKTIEQEQKAISHLIEIVTGRKNIDENTKLFDLLQDIS